MVVTHPGDGGDELPVVVLHLQMVPLPIGNTHGGSDSNLGHGVAGGEHKFNSLALNGKRDKIVLAIKSAIVEEETGMLNGGKFELNIEFEPLSE